MAQSGGGVYRVTMATPIKITTVTDRRTGAVISRKEEKGTPYEVSRVKISGGSPALPKPTIGTRGVGPSGKPKIHIIQCSSRKKAEDAARNAGKGNPPIHEAAKSGFPAHFHPADRWGRKIQDGTHFVYY
ncbi:unnamed protein product [Adineta steineri]|uniref:Uncharacterized protein n=1 Tax=Adineta steineri TaxID=433720 RepID=A0A815JAW2_9BILA|nr:unnamed protein product [Adineta steineri]CAF1376956.1 unnamed protein product [Adineta steineri]CAF3499957.1 unnamed protein product [Adineta steineri]CAF3858139.1 unnamed protein product [Adineta steineri]